MNRHTGIKVLAGFMGVYHILMGILGIVSGAWAAWGAHTLWHANVTVDPQFTYLFNSYYKQLEGHPLRALRGAFSRPTLAEVLAYRAHEVEVGLQRNAGCRGRP